jgi:hypothetical protein
MRWLACLALVASLTGCEKRTERVRLDPGLMFQFESRFTEVLARPAVDKAFDKFFDGVFGDPAVGKIGDQLATSLASDPKVMTPVGKFMQDLQTSPSMQRLVIDLMKANPHATPEEIGELVGKQLETAFASPKLAATFQQIGTDLIRRLDARDTLKPLGDKLDRMITDDYEEKWSRRLVELNDGSTPSPTRATTLLLDHALEAKRLEKFVVVVMTSPTVRAQCAKLVARTLALPDVAQELRALVADLVEDPALVKKMTELFELLLASHPDDKAIESTLRAMLLSKRTVDGASRFLRMVVANPEVAKAVLAMADALAADKDLHAAFDELMTGW